jgi:hypothetical protein
MFTQTPQRYAAGAVILIGIWLFAGPVFNAIRTTPAPAAVVQGNPAEACPPDHRRADLHLSQLVSPNQAVAAGAVFTTALTLRNIGSCPVSDAEVLLPINPQLAELIDVTTGTAQSWVSQVGSDHLLLRSGPIAAGALVTATIRQRIRPLSADGSLLQQRLRFSAAQNINGPDGSSNIVRLVIAEQDRTVALLPLGVNPPQAPAGTLFEFGSDLFAPDEPVSFWVNDPLNQDLPVTTTLAAADGSLTIAYDSRDRPPGRYQMAAFGNFSGLRAAVAFEILPALATATAADDDGEPLVPTPTLTAGTVITISVSTATSTPTATSSASTATSTPTATSSASTATSTPTATSSVDTATPTATLTSTLTTTPTATSTITPTSTPTATPTQTT